MQSVFISGGAGFIGSHLVSRLRSKTEVRRITVLDNFSSGTRLHLAPACDDARVIVIEADLKDADAVKRAMEGADTVFHLAANPDIAKAVSQPDIDFWEGTYLLQNVLEAVRVNSVPRLYYTSGSGVYGENPDAAFSETYGPCVPISTYGASKLACEAMIAAYCHMFGLKACAFRFANVVGPRQTHGVGYDFVRRLLTDPTRLRILGDGTQSKSYIHVDDILDAVLLAGDRSTRAYDVFNVATDDYVTVREIAEIAVDVCGLAPDAVRFEFTGGNRGWKGDVPVVRFDCAKIRALGWANKRNSREAVRDSMIAMREEVACG